MLSGRCGSFLSGPFETRARRAAADLHQARGELLYSAAIRVETTCDDASVDNPDCARRDQERKQTRGGQPRVSGNDASVLAPTRRPCGIETEVADSGARSWPAASGRGVLGRCERGP